MENQDLTPVSPISGEIVLRPTGGLRFVFAAFLAVWLAGWAIGEVVVLAILLGPAAAPFLEALREVLPIGIGRVPLPSESLPPPVFAVLALWLAFWTWGGMAAAWQLLRLVAGSDRYVVRPGSVLVRRAAGPFGRTRLYRAGAVEAIVERRRRAQLLAVVAGRGELLSAGVPAEMSGRLAERLREALGLREAGASVAAGRAAGDGAPPVPPDWQETPRPEGGVDLAAPPARSRRTAGCALAVAVVVVAGAAALLAAAIARSGEVPGIAGLAAAAVVLAVVVGALCVWVALARDAWVLEKGRIERERRFGPWSRRRAVRDGALVVTLATDDDGDDVFELEARGEGGPLRLAKATNAGPEVLAFARYAAWHSGFRLDVPREAREAAGESSSG